MAIKIFGAWTEQFVWALTISVGCKDKIFSEQLLHELPAFPVFSNIRKV